ncbi:MAG TPA: sugar ABC transporter permease [Candidatus Dormibacteraeota bacterium]|nr:sugar ABC transporter permease [Candidatus Dormibacteraeota bacterium]
MSDAAAAAPGMTSASRKGRSDGVFQALNLDSRMLGMVASLAIIWIGFQVLSGLIGPTGNPLDGTFLTAQNLYNLSQQTVTVGILATGMVLVIVSRNIDLSIGSIVGLTGYVMAMMQAVWIPVTLKLGFDQPYTWIVCVLVGMALGALIGALQGYLSSYIGIPSFIVTLGGLLVWRGVVFEINQGQTVSPLDKSFLLLGGGPTASLGEVGTIVFGVLACAAITYSMLTARRKQHGYGFAVRPMWATGVLIVIGWVMVVAFCAVMIAYPWPAGLATQYAHDNGIVQPAGGLRIPTGIANPVVILIGVTIAMTYLTTRRRFGRYVFAIGGNPEAAELGGINVRRTLLLTFVLMGALSGLAAAVQTARLQAAVTSLGTQFELDTIAAAVIGGTSFSGGIGTIPGAVLGALVMQSLRSGMLLLRVDSPIQDIVVGVVLVAAIGLDTYVRRRSSR